MRNFTQTDGVTLREYFEALLADLKTQIEHSRVGMEKRLDGMNEFRGALKDQTDKMMPREEYYIQHENLIREIKALNTFKDEMKGAATREDVNRATAFAVFGIVIGIVGIILGFFGK
jgi:hypothetical protein